MRLVDADGLKELFNSYSSHPIYDEWSTLGILGVIDEMPTFDVAIVNQGKFISDMSCSINKDYLENKMKETTERIKQIWKTEEDYVKYRSEINYYMGYKNALGDLIDKINEVEL